MITEVIEDRHHYLRIIETESSRLSKLSDNLLRLASLESDQVRFEPKPYRLDRQIRNRYFSCPVSRSGRPKALVHGIVSLGEIAVTADEDLLSQVWMNLLHNSIKFTPAQGKICVGLQRQGDRIAFSIADTGPGISDEDQLRIFERFYKADKSRTRSTNSGSGLGLSIVHKIVELHHGTVSVASQLGAGTTFTILLPSG